MSTVVNIFDEGTNTLSPQVLPDSAKPAGPASRSGPVANRTTARGGLAWKTAFLAMWGRSSTLATCLQQWSMSRPTRLIED